MERKRKALKPIIKIILSEIIIESIVEKNDTCNIIAETVKQALLGYNDSQEGNKFTDQPKMGEQKFIINKVKLLNHRWIIAEYSNGKLFGEVMLKYFVEEKGSISFEIMNSYLYPANLN